MLKDEADYKKSTGHSLLAGREWKPPSRL